MLGDLMQSNLTQKIGGDDDDDDDDGDDDGGDGDDDDDGGICRGWQEKSR